MSIVIYRAREIVTLDKNCPIATAIAVKDERIFSVGTFEDVLENLSNYSFEVDNRYENLVIVPGFIEAHGHVFSEGMLTGLVWTGRDDRLRPDGTMSKGSATIDEVVERLKSSAGNYEGAIAGYGFDPVFFDGRALLRHDLDKVSTNKGVVVMNASGHLAYANSKQMEICGVDENTDVPGVMKDANGIPTGEFHEEAMSLVLDRVKMVNGDPAQLALAGGELLRRVGVTTGSDISMVTAGPAFEAFKATVSSDDFPARVTYSPKITDMTRRMSEDEVFAIVSKLKSESNERFTFGPLKWVSDGSIQGFTGKLNWPGYCGGDDHGQLLLDEDTLIKQLTPYHNAGFQIAVHTNGDEAIDTVIGAFEKILNTSPRYDHRHRLEHFQMASPAAIKKMAALNLCANIFSNHIYYWGDTHRTKTMGPDKARRMDAAASAIEAGIQISIHSDHPVTPVNPLFTMWCAVNRVTRSGFVLGPAERISPLQALTAMTLGSAYLMNRDDMLGSLEVGKWADFTVLAENPLSVAPMAIKDIEVVGTVIGAKPTGK